MISIISRTPEIYRKLKISLKTDFFANPQYTIYISHTPSLSRLHPTSHLAPLTALLLAVQFSTKLRSQAIRGKICRDHRHAGEKWGKGRKHLLENYSLSALFDGEPVRVGAVGVAGRRDAAGGRPRWRENKSSAAESPEFLALAQFNAAQNRKAAGWMHTSRIYACISSCLTNRIV